ncbi:hypothetical protein FNV43_RR04542 [Rhamnella rubrinervis]|uniref:Uncharacterized protein n=1 Tax=Rhamnella rubrinervis TaxID=2594499 RepID=A0A8K0HLZ4_9ROSA|nr:hypothetical protein FNV43_RR04542 [Rhamnella rubrinervis]
MKWAERWLIKEPVVPFRLGRLIFFIYARGQAWLRAPIVRLIFGTHFPLLVINGKVESSKKVNSSGENFPFTFNIHAYPTLAHRTLLVSNFKNPFLSCCCSSFTTYHHPLPITCPSSSLTTSSPDLTSKGSKVTLLPNTTSNWSLLRSPQVVHLLMITLSRDQEPGVDIDVILCPVVGRDSASKSTQVGVSYSESVKSFKRRKLILRDESEEEEEEELAPLWPPSGKPGLAGESLWTTLGHPKVSRGDERTLGEFTEDEAEGGYAKDAKPSERVVHKEKVLGTYIHWWREHKEEPTVDALRMSFSLRVMSTLGHYYVYKYNKVQHCIKKSILSSEHMITYGLWVDPDAEEDDIIFFSNYLTLYLHVNESHYFPFIVFSAMNQNIRSTLKGLAHKLAQRFSYQSSADSLSPSWFELMKEALRVVEPNFIVEQLDEVNLQSIYPAVMDRVSGTSSLEATTEVQLEEANMHRELATEAGLPANIGTEGEAVHIETSTIALEIEEEKQ